MSGSLTTWARKIWNARDNMIMVCIALIVIMSVAAFSFSGPTPRDVAIQQIAATQNSMLVEQQKTNSLLRDLIKAQEQK